MQVTLPVDNDYWDCKALLLLMRSHRHVTWMRGLRIFTAPNGPGQDSYDACVLVGIEPTQDNKLALTLACERLGK